MLANAWKGGVAGEKVQLLGECQPGRRTAEVLAGSRIPDS
jgi:hypothetical protein